MTPQWLLQHFDRLAEAPDAIPRLRQFILDLAVRGKLVEQDPNDEPALELLKRIQLEKARLIATGMAKKEKSRPPPQYDEPFRIPENWCWSQVAEIGFINPRNAAEDGLPASFVPMTLIPADYGASSTWEVRTWGEIKSGFTHFADGDVVLAKITPCFQNRKSTVFRGLSSAIGAGTTELHVARPVYANPDYLLVFFKCQFFIETGVPRMTGTAGQKRVPLDYFAYSPFPLPPVAEQYRIVAKVDELMAHCDRFEAAQAERESRRDRLVATTHASLADPSTPNSQPSTFFINHLPHLTARAEHIQQLRQTILDLAVRGKLVAQDPNDEPTAELVKRIAARFPILVVDEYQDLGYALDRIVQCLCFGAGIRLVAVGDPDQSIYGFTGAEPSLLRNLAARNDVEKIQLRLNYRCGSAIIQASEVVLAEERGFESSRDEPGAVFFHERPAGIVDQAIYICETLIPEALKRRVGRKLGDVAVLYLDKNDGDIIANAVCQTGWQFIRVDGNSPYQASPVTCWLEDCAAWCSGARRTAEVRLSELVRRWLAFNASLHTDKERRIAELRLVRFLQRHRDPNLSFSEWLSEFLDKGLNAALEREPRLRDDKEKVDNLRRITSPEGPLAAYTVAFFGGQGGSPEHLRLTTLHSAKGLEYDVVAMLGLEDGRIPYYNDAGGAIREKRRLFYVGLTRARHEVHLLYSGWYSRFGRTFQNGRSRFIHEVEAKLLQQRRR